MSLNRTSRRAAARTELFDAVMDAYVTWREESAAVTATYENWRCAARDERSNAYDEHAAALDREEQAAFAYQGLLEQAAT
jgi:hypothetical protein